MADSFFNSLAKPLPIIFIRFPMRCLIFLFFVLLSIPCFAQQSIRGTVTDGQDGKALANVVIQNIHINTGTTTDSTGAFSIGVEKGQLVEFRRLGYKTKRLRIPSGTVPAFFRIVLDKGAIELDEVTIRKQFEDYKRDSTRYAEMYQAPLRVGRLSDADKFQDPFLALSPSRRKIWAFQEEYQRNEELRYVDYHFSEKRITAITGLKGDSLIAYRNQFRPSYEAVRGWNEYELFNYIKKTAAFFRRGS